jgi:hypothetical protein
MSEINRKIKFSDKLLLDRLKEYLDVNKKSILFFN